MECSHWTLKRHLSFTLWSSHNHLSELMSDMGIVFSISWQRWWVEYYTYFLFAAKVCSTNWFTLKPLRLTLVQKLFDRVTAAWRKEGWRNDLLNRQLVHIHRPDWKNLYLWASAAKEPRALNESILSKHSQGKWRLNPICHSSAGPYTRHTAIKAQMEEGLPAGDSSAACISYFQCLCTSCCIHM